MRVTLWNPGTDVSGREANGGRLRGWVWAGTGVGVQWDGVGLWQGEVVATLERPPGPLEKNVVQS